MVSNNKQQATSSGLHKGVDNEKRKWMKFNVNVLLGMSNHQYDHHYTLSYADTDPPKITREGRKDWKSYCIITEGGI
eukprot:3464720-Ditylum_brightwellii.AAC.1